MNKTIGILEFKDFDAFVGGKMMPVYLRSTNPNQKKNGLEDLKKARKNLDWLIEELEHED